MFQKLQIIIKYNTFTDFSIFETMYSLFFFFKKKFKQIFFKFYIKKKYKKLIILKAPFVNKKSRDQLGFLFYKGQVCLNFKYNLISYYFLKKLYTYIKNQVILNKIFFKITIIQIGFLF